jgi:hypothetical protein
MATSSKGQISIESGRVLTTWRAMTDAGDHQVFYAGSTWSSKSGYEAEVRPDGMVSGRNVLSANAAEDTVTVAAFTAYSKGILYSVSATTDTFTRATDAGRSKVVSVYMGSDGNIAVAPGTQGASTAFSETRDAAGGPPLIPVGGIEIGQIRVTTSTGAVITASQIYQSVGSHVDRYDYPNWVEHPIGLGYTADSAYEVEAHIKFMAALTATQVGSTYKHVYIQYYTPTFIELDKTSDFVPAETTHSVSSTNYYSESGSGSVGSKSSSLGQGSFTCLLGNGVNDALLGEKDELITVKFWPDRNKNPYILTQGYIGISRSFPITDQNSAAVTVSSEEGSMSFES